jgi:L-malate glycosyltransferase
MKICIFTENHYKGGLDTFIINLVNSWPFFNDDMTLFCNSDHPGLFTIKDNLNNKISIKKYSFFFTNGKYKGFKGGVFERYRVLRGVIVLLNNLVEYPFLFIWYLLILYKDFKKSDYEQLLVVNGGYPASLICRVAVIAWKLSGKKSKAVMNFHSMPSNSPKYKAIQEMFVDYLVIKFSKKIIAVSSVILENLKERRLFSQTNKTMFIHNGINDPHYTENKENINNNQDYCLMLATFHEYKGHGYAIEAFAKIQSKFPNIKLLIFGYGKKSEKDKIKKQISELPYKDSIYLGDFIKNPANLIKNASVMLVPSRSQESFNYTIIEAMALGTPVVATDVGGIPEVIGNQEAGIVCPKDDISEFSMSIINILSNKQLAKKLTRNGRKRFENNFRSEVMSHKYSLILRN